MNYCLDALITGTLMDYLKTPTSRQCLKKSSLMTVKPLFAEPYTLIKSKTKMTSLTRGIMKLFVLLTLTALITAHTHARIEMSSEPGHTSESGIVFEDRYHTALKKSLQARPYTADQIHEFEEDYSDTITNEHQSQLREADPFMAVKWETMRVAYFKRQSTRQ